MESSTRTIYALGALLLILCGCEQEPFSQAKWDETDTRGEVVSAVVTRLNTDKPKRDEVQAWLGKPTTTKDGYDRWYAGTCGSLIKDFCTLTVYYTDDVVRKAQIDTAE